LHAERVLDYMRIAQEIGVRQKEEEKKRLNLVYFVFSKTLLQGEVLLQWNASIPIA